MGRGGRRSKPRKFSNVISLETCSRYMGYVAVWFADVATRLLLNTPLTDVSVQQLQQLYNEANKLYSNQGRDLSSVIPIPITGNDNRDLLNLSSALQSLYKATQNVREVYLLPAAFSSEFAEYVRKFVPKTATSTLKRETIGISSEILALALIGADLTSSYRVARGRDVEYGYTFVNVYNPRVLRLLELNRSVRIITQRIVNGDGSTQALYVGIAARVARGLGSRVFDIDGHTTYTSVRILHRQAPMLKAFETVDITSLAQTILKLGISKAVVDLISFYPDRNQQRNPEYRKLRSFIESLARAIVLFNELRDFEELYRVVRVLTSEEYRSALSRCVKDWPEILESLLSLRV